MNTTHEDVPTFAADSPTPPAEIPATNHERELERAGWADESTSEVEPWETGKEIQGEFLRLKPGAYEKSPLLIFRDTTGRTRTVGCPAVLQDRMEALNRGEAFYVRCTGKTTFKSGNEGWTFKIMVAPRQGSR